MIVRRITKGSTGLRRKWGPTALVTTGIALGVAALVTACGGGSNSAASTSVSTATPIQHVVVIFQENVSFDHYFGTYPTATNPVGEPQFTAASNTPTVNTLATPLNVNASFAALGTNLLTANPTASNATNAGNAINPFRLDRSQVATASQNHNYDAEQKGFDAGAMDLAPFYVGTANGASPTTLAQVAPLNTKGLVMGYYDGNTVTALWNYAQHYAMSDNAFGTTFGPSAVGAINLISGQTNGVIATNVSATVSSAGLSNDNAGGITVTGDPQPLGDVCTNRDAVQLGGKNIGDLLNAQKVSWGFFQGGFDLTLTNANGTTGCNRTTYSPYYGAAKTDYVQHHQPFQFYASTRNLTHARPSSVAAIGNTYQADGVTLDPANHQYDSHDFFDAVSAGNFPAVSFLKAPGYQDGHAGYSTPLDEQEFVASTINFLQKQPGWANTLVVIAYDDSDGWYDHQASPIVNPSSLTATLANYISNTFSGTGLADWLSSPTTSGSCTSIGAQQSIATPATSLAGATGTANVQGRCGHGPRLPFLVISPYAKTNFVDHTMLDQTSILRFVEDNWLGGQRITGSFDALAGTITNMLNFSSPPNVQVQLDPATGVVLPCTNCS